MAPWIANERVCAADRRGAGSPPDPALVHRRPRPTQVVRHLTRRAGERVRGGHALRRLVDRRVQPRARRATCSPSPTPTRSSCCHGPSATRRRPGCSATSRSLDGTPFEGDPSQRAASATSTRPHEPRASRSSSHRRWSSSTSPTVTRARPPEPLDSGGLLRPHHRRCGQRPAQAHHPPPSRPWESRSSTRSTRTAPASTRSTCATPTR